MGRHAGDYLLGTMFLAAAMLLALTHAKSESVVRHPDERVDAGHTFHGSQWKYSSELRQRATIAKESERPACAVLKSLSRGSRIVVGSLDVSGKHHGLLVTVGNDDSARIESLPVTRYSVNDIRRWQNENGDIGKLKRYAAMRCSIEPAKGLPAAEVCLHASSDSPDRVFLTPHFVDAGAIHEPVECQFIGESPRVRIFVDQRLAQSMNGGQFRTWSESLTSAAEFRSLPIVNAWVGAIRDVDHDQKLSIVVTDLDRRKRHASGCSPIYGCIRETDFRSDADFCGDIIYIDPSIFELAICELAALLTHETTHAAVCSMRPDDSIGDGVDRDKAESCRRCAESRVPAWLNEAVAHFVELQRNDAGIRAAGISRNFQRRIDDFFANPAGSPIVAAEDVLSLEERRGGSRGAATLFLGCWFSSSETLRQFVHSRAPFDRRIEDLAQAPFADVFRDWTLSLVSLSEHPTFSARQSATSCEHRPLRFDLLPAVSDPTRFSLLGTAFRCFECSEDIESLVIESDVAAKLQISIIEPEARVQ